MPDFYDRYHNLIKEGDIVAFGNCCSNRPIVTLGKVIGYTNQKVKIIPLYPGSGGSFKCYGSILKVSYNLIVVKYPYSMNEIYKYDNDLHTYVRTNFEDIL